MVDLIRQHCHCISLVPPWLSTILGHFLVLMKQFLLAKFVYCFGYHLMTSEFSHEALWVYLMPGCLSGFGSSKCIFYNDIFLISELGLALLISSCDFTFLKEIYIYICAHARLCTIKYLLIMCKIFGIYVIYLTIRCNTFKI